MRDLVQIKKKKKKRLNYIPRVINSRVCGEKYVRINRKKRRNCNKIKEKSKGRNNSLLSTI